MHGTICALTKQIVMCIYVLNLRKTTRFIIQTTKGSINGCIELVGSSTSNKVKNHCTRVKGNFPFIRELS